MNDHWIEGRFEGTYEGKRRTPPGSPEEARRFSFRLRSGVVRDAEIVDGPFAEGPSTDAAEEIRQDRVGEIFLSVPALDLERQGTSIFDVRVVDWRLSRPAEAKGRSFGRIEGRLRARLLPAQPELEPGLEFAPAPDTGATPISSEAAWRKGASATTTTTRSRKPSSQDPLASSRAVHIEGPDARTVYGRLIAWAAWAAIAAVSAGLWMGCGGPVAAAWAGTTVCALCVRRVARAAIETGSARQGWLAASLVGAQVALLLEPLAAGGRLDCTAPSALGLAGLSVAVVGAALLRGRGTLFACSVVYLAAMLSWCNATATSCIAQPAPLPAAQAMTRDARTPPPRTSPDGHWPVMPGRHPGAGIGVTSVSGSGGGTSGPVDRAGAAGDAGDAGGAMPGHGGAVGMPSTTPSGSASHVDGLGPGTGGEPGAAFGPDDLTWDAEGAVRSHAPATSKVGATRERTSERSSAPPAGETPPAVTRAGGNGSTRGGWVATDQRSAMAGAELISLEHANRVPKAFYESGGQRRVYVPTDAIFEPGEAAIRATGPLQLGRIAALLESRSDARTLLVVHTDAGGGLDAQRSLAERRAASVRAWLLDRGHLDGTRFDVAAAGAAHPLVPPDGSYAAQQPNRRIEISLQD